MSVPPDSLRGRPIPGAGEPDEYTPRGGDEARPTGPTAPGKPRNVPLTASVPDMREETTISANEPVDRRLAGTVPARGDGARWQGTGPAALRLNESQRRALAITVRLVEERLSTIRDLLDREDGGALYRRPAPRFTPEERARIDALLARMREVVVAIQEAFALPSEERDARGMIVALLSMSWQSLGEIDARGMRAYGDTDPELGPVLDPYVRELMDLALTLESAVSGG